MAKVIAVIPCYNEETTISDVVFRSNQLLGMVIVADDNSNDATSNKAKESGAYVVRNFGKRGAGIATKTGVDKALVEGCDIVVTLDGDGQHNPDEILKVVNPVEQGVADIVVGSRFINGQGSMIPKYRTFGIKVITWLYNVGSKQKLTDAQCCFRAFNREVLRRVGITESGFAFSVEVLVKARKMGFRITEVPVSVLYHRQFSKNSSLNPVRHGLGVAWGVIRWRIKVELLGLGS